MGQVTVSRELLLNLQDAANRLHPFVGGLGKAVLREIEIDVASALEQPAVEPCSGWSEAALAWEVCASIHASFAKGKDPFFKTRHNDFVGHAENARKNALAAPQPQPAAEPVGYVRMLNGEPTPDDTGCVFSYGKNPYRDTYGDEEWLPVSIATLQALPAPVQESCIHADLVVTAIEQWKSLWLKVPSFGNKVNKATREAITESHGPLFKLLHEADAAKRMPAGCTSPSGCRNHGCHGACLPDEAQQPAPQAQQPRKAVKLSEDDIRKVLGVEYVDSAQNRDLFLSDIRAIEQAVLKKNGVMK